jgi:hypothetical protein
MDFTGVAGGRSTVILIADVWRGPLACRIENHLDACLENTSKVEDKRRDDSRRGSGVNPSGETNRISTLAVK